MLLHVELLFLLTCCNFIFNLTNLPHKFQDIFWSSWVGIIYFYYIEFLFSLICFSYLLYCFNYRFYQFWLVVILCWPFELKYTENNEPLRKRRTWHWKKLLTPPSRRNACTKSGPFKWLQAFWFLPWYFHSEFSFDFSSWLLPWF